MDVTTAHLDKHQAHAKCSRATGWGGFPVGPSSSTVPELKRKPLSEKMLTLVNGRNQPGLPGHVGAPGGPGHLGCAGGGPASEEADGLALSFGARITDMLSPEGQATDSPDPSSLLSMPPEAGCSVVQWLVSRAWLHHRWQQQLSHL